MSITPVGVHQGRPYPNGANKWGTNTCPTEVPPAATEITAPDAWICRAWPHGQLYISI